jgi:hypothetical protein
MPPTLDPNGPPVQDTERLDRPRTRWATVAGYCLPIDPHRVRLYLARSLQPHGSLRYVGWAEVVYRTVAARRAFTRELRALRLPTHPPIFASPCPARVSWVKPQLLVEVCYQGWSAGGLMHNLRVVAIASTVGSHAVGAPPTDAPAAVPVDGASHGVGLT